MKAEKAAAYPVLSVRFSFLFINIFIFYFGDFYNCCGDQ